MVSGGAGTLNSMSGYTYEDYLAMELPEEKRVEIIDGVIYDIAAPTTVVQPDLLVKCSQDARVDEYADLIDT